MFKDSNSKIRTIKQGDPKFMLSDGVVVCPRAGFEINRQCPDEYKRIISECIFRGWLAPIAYLTDRELVFLGLAE